MRPVIGLQDLARPGGALGRVQIAIAGNLGELAEGHDGAFHRGIAIAVDDEARIDLADGEGIQRIGQETGDGGGPDIPGDMALEFSRRQAEIAELSRQAPAAVIAGEEKGRGTVLMLDREGRRLVLGQEAVLRGGHRGSSLNR